jgi:hypothetical protein
VQNRERKLGEAAELIEKVSVAQEQHVCLKVFHLHSAWAVQSISRSGDLLLKKLKLVHHHLKTDCRNWCDENSQLGGLDLMSPVRQSGLKVGEINI